MKIDKNIIFNVALGLGLFAIIGFISFSAINDHYRLNGTRAESDATAQKLDNLINVLNGKLTDTPSPSVATPSK